MNEQQIIVNQEPQEQAINIANEQIERSIDASGELSVLHGIDGVSPIATVEQTETGATITITDRNGTTTAEITNGQDGRDGIDGQDGQDGRDGRDGQDGRDGTDGVSATVAVGTVATGNAGTNVIITNTGTNRDAILNFTIPRGDKGETGADGADGRDGRDGVDGQNGQDGQDGQDGFSPTATVVKSGDTATITITDKNGTTTASVKDGSDATQVNSDWNANSGVAQILNKPTKLSQFTNDSGFLTSYTETDPTVPSWAKQSTKPTYAYSEITGTPTIPTKTSDLTNDGADNTSTYLESDEVAWKTKAIPTGQVDATSTATAFTATVAGITELRDGVCMLLKNGVITSASGFTININGLGAKPVYNNMASATAETTIFNINYTMLFVYDSTRIAGGCWVCYRGYNSDTNTIGYQVRTNSQSLPMSSITYRYRLLFTSANGTKYVPANNSSSTNATTDRTVCQEKINPFGRIFYYGTTASVSADSRPAVGSLWEQYAITLGYSFAKGSALTMTSWKPVYLKCAPQSDGSAIIDSTTPWVQDLPTTEDGKIYIFLGVAYSATQVELQLDHPVYWFKGGMIRPYTNQLAGVSSFNGSTGDITYTAPVQSVNGATGAITGLQTTANLVMSVSSASTDSQYPSAKLFYDTVGDVETILQTLNNGGGAQ